jgi:hypothetical protein
MYGRGRVVVVVLFLGLAQRGSDRGLEVRSLLLLLSGLVAVLCMDNGEGANGQGRGGEQ